MIVLGLTGSIGMGKTTTAQMFRDRGVPVFDADAIVHGLYEPGGEAVSAMQGLVPEAVQGGGVDRVILRQKTLAQPELFKQIEARVHPLVAQKRVAFLQQAREMGAKLVVLDMPLHSYLAGREPALAAPHAGRSRPQYDRPACVPPL